jgi:hypothetical protein
MLYPLHTGIRGSTLSLFESVRYERLNDIRVGNKWIMNDTGQNGGIESKTCSGVQRRYPGPWSKPASPVKSR